MKTRRTFVTVAAAALLAVMLMAALFAWNGHRSSMIHMDGIGVHITGLYGGTTGFGDISSVEVADAIPAVGLRTKGYSFCGTCKGYFTVDGWGRFIHSANRKPYLLLTATDGRRTAFQTTDDDQARELCQAIREKRDYFGPAIAMTKKRERHCEERSDAAILMGNAMAEIASGQP